MDEEIVRIVRLNPKKLKYSLAYLIEAEDRNLRKALIESLSDFVGLSTRTISRIRNLKLEDSYSPSSEIILSIMSFFEIQNRELFELVEVAPQIRESKNAA